MTFDIKDRAIIKASALVGYCESAPEWGGLNMESYMRWREGLLERSKFAGQAISALYNPPVTISTVQE